MIEVRTCARLHMGLLDSNGEQGRLYGSIGLAINYPHLVLKAESSEQLQIEGLEPDRVTAYAQRFIHHYGMPAGAHLNLAKNIPAHVGLGSGTQLALAVGTALARLAGLQLSTQEIALVLGRGLHSGIGIAAFQRGGFVLDGGQRILSNGSDHSSGNGHRGSVDKNNIPPLLFQHPMPKDWYFVAIIPKADPGFSGEREVHALMQLPAAPSSLVEKISRLLLMKMLPALMENDILSFGQALTGIQNMVGDCFSSVQGGRFATPLLEKLVEFLLNRDAAGAGQSSWGPTVYGLVKGREPAQLLAQEAQAYVDDLGGGEAFCVQPQNRGAQIREFKGSGHEENPHSIRH
jgi:beta-ribofuranosylaminobenzene 5'-phosphate synthase